MSEFFKRVELPKYGFVTDEATLTRLYIAEIKMYYQDF